MLQIKQLNVEIQDYKILNDINFEIDTGDILGIIGLNGSGKSTLLRTIVNLIPYSGSIRFDIEDTRNLIGFVPEEPIVYLDLSVSDNLRITSLKKGKPIDLDDILNRFNLFQLKKKKVRTLSMGQTKRMSIAMAAINNPKILLFDEPLNGLDETSELTFYKLIATNQNDKLIIISSHNLSLIEDFCTKLLILKNGRLTYFGSLKKIIKEYGSLNAAYKTYCL